MHRSSLPAATRTASASTWPALARRAGADERVGEQHGEPKLLEGGARLDRLGERPFEERDRRLHCARARVRTAESLDGPWVRQGASPACVERLLEQFDRRRGLPVAKRDLAETGKRGRPHRITRLQMIAIEALCPVDLAQPEGDLGVDERRRLRRLRNDTGRKPLAGNLETKGELVDHLQRRHPVAGFDPRDVGGSAAGEGEPALGEPAALARGLETDPHLARRVDVGRQRPGHRFSLVAFGQCSFGGYDRLSIRTTPEEVMAVLLRSTLLVALAGVFACTAGASGRNWAAPQIRAVTEQGILGTSPATFAPQPSLTQAALADAVRATDAIQHPVPPAASPPAPVAILSTVGADAIVGGSVPLEIQAPSRTIDRVDLAVDGTEVGTALDAPYVFDLDAGRLANGPHQLAVNVAFGGGGSAIAVWQITVSNEGARDDRTIRACRAADREVVAAGGARRHRQGPQPRTCSITPFPRRARSR